MHPTRYWSLAAQDIWLVNQGTKTWLACSTICVNLTNAGMRYYSSIIFFVNLLYSFFCNIYYCNIYYILAHDGHWHSLIHYILKPIKYVLYIKANKYVSSTCQQNLYKLKTEFPTSWQSNTDIDQNTQIVFDAALQLKSLWTYKFTGSRGQLTISQCWHSMKIGCWLQGIPENTGVAHREKTWTNSCMTMNLHCDYDFALWLWSCTCDYDFDNVTMKLHCIVVYYNIIDISPRPDRFSNKKPPMRSCATWTVQFQRVPLQK
jgi:hypothetical protein